MALLFIYGIAGIFFSGGSFKEKNYIASIIYAFVGMYFLIAYIGHYK